MASLGVLASLMQTLTPQGGMPQYNPMEEAQQQTLLQGRRMGNETALLQLADIKRQQEAAAAFRQFIAAHPEYALGGGGGPPQSTIGSLQTAPGGPPGGGPLTQQPFGPGGVGPTQTVPGGQDLSRFAGVSPQGGGPIPPDMMRQLTPTVTPPYGATGQAPTSTLATLGPQPQAPNPQQRLLALARTNPEAALKVQSLMQGQQDAALKRDEQRLTMGTKVMEYVGRVAQGVTDQASLDAARAELARIHPQAAAQLPQTYSKEAMAPFIAKANSVLENQTLGLKELQAQIEARKLQMQAANIPNYTGDATLDAMIYTRMKDQPPGTIPSRAIVEDAYKQREADKLRVSREQGVAQEAGKPLGETATLRFNTLTQAEDTVKKLSTEFTPEERARFVGMGGMTMGQEQLKQLAADAGIGKADPKFARFAALVALAKAEAFSTAGKALTETESGVVYGYIPTGKEYSAEEFEQKLRLAQERVPSMLDRELKLATTPRSELPGMRARGELSASTRPPTSQGSTGSAKPVSQMNAEETRAEIAAIKARGGR